MCLRILDTGLSLLVSGSVNETEHIWYALQLLYVELVSFA